MLTILAKQFELTEENTTARALRRTWWMMVLSLPAFLIVVWVSFHGIPTNFISLVFCTLVFLTASFPMMVFLSSRFVNRFYFPDKYLDEWEIRIKHKSIVFAVQVLISSMVVVGFIALIMEAWFNIASLSFTTLQIGIGTFLILIAFFYVQAFKALSLVEPIDEDEYTNGPIEKRSNRFILLFVGVVSLIALVVSAPLIMSGYDAGGKYGRALAICHNQDMKLDKFDWETKTGKCEGLASVDKNRPEPENASGKDAE